MASSAEKFESDIEGKKALVLFHADWCGHCKNFMPEWDKISSEVESMDGQSVSLLKVECGNAKENNNPITEEIIISNIFIFVLFISDIS